MVVLVKPQITSDRDLGAAVFPFVFAAGAFQCLPLIAKQLGKICLPGRLFLFFCEVDGVDLRIGEVLIGSEEIFQKGDVLAQPGDFLKASGVVPSTSPLPSDHAFGSKGLMVYSPEKKSI